MHPAGTNGSRCECYRLLGVVDDDDDERQYDNSSNGTPPYENADISRPTVIQHT